jgi:multiple sugar transport system ATP-binding protein
VVDAEAKAQGATFKAKLDLVESLGAEYYAYFHLEGTRVESEHLSEVAADAGLSEVPSAQAGDTSLVARLNEMSEINEGDEIELWLDTRRLHLFDPATGDNLVGAPSGNGAPVSGAGEAGEKPVAGPAS